MPDETRNALTFLEKLALKIRDGELNVLELYVNPSVVDACNMSISVKTCRGSSDATGIPSVEYATAGGKDVVNRTRMRELQGAWDREQARKEREKIAAIKKREREGILTDAYNPFAYGPRSPDGGFSQVEKPKKLPPEPKPEKRPLVNGARELDLD